MVVGLVAFLGAGCGTPSVPGSGASGSGVASSRVASSGCAHPYYPLREGYAVSYKSSVKGLPESIFTVKAADTSGDKATLQYTFTRPGGPADAGISMSLDIECVGGDLKAKGQLDMASAMSGKRVTSTTKKSSGELLPKNLAVGSEWDGEFQVETVLDNPTAVRLGMGNVSSTMTLHHKAVREEEVTVPAGTYTALVVESDMQILTSLPGATGYKPPTIRTTEYWVKGVGLVKSVTESSMIEATSITLP